MQTNKELVSKANRLKMESEKTFILTEKAKEYKEPPKVKSKPKEVNVFQDFTGGPLTRATPGDSTTASSEVSLYSQICSCGSRGDVFKGYCKECIKKMRTKFEKLLERFQEIKKEYDSFNT